MTATRMQPGKILPLPCVATAFVAKTLPFLAMTQPEELVDRTPAKCWAGRG